jgi:hypothetical protein
MRARRQLERLETAYNTTWNAPEPNFRDRLHLYERNMMQAEEDRHRMCNRGKYQREVKEEHYNYFVKAVGSLHYREDPIEHVLQFDANSVDAARAEQICQMVCDSPYCKRWGKHTFALTAQREFGREQRLLCKKCFKHRQLRSEAMWCPCDFCGKDVVECNGPTSLMVHADDDMPVILCQYHRKVIEENAVPWFKPAPDDAMTLFFEAEGSQDRAVKRQKLSN